MVLHWASFMEPVQVRIPRDGRERAEPRRAVAPKRNCIEGNELECVSLCFDDDEFVSEIPAPALTSAECEKGFLLNDSLEIVPA